MTETYKTDGQIVDEAAEVTKTRLVSYYAHKFPDEYHMFSEQNDTDSILALATAEKCTLGSVLALHYTAYRYPARFEKMAILSGADELSAFKRLAWTHHSYFIAKALDGPWYANSPANYNSINSRNTLVEPDLDSLLEKLRVQEGGIWPNSGFINSSFRRYGPLPHTNNTALIGYLNIERVTGSDHTLLVNDAQKLTLGILFPHESAESIYN